MAPRENSRGKGHREGNDGAPGGQRRRGPDTRGPPHTQCAPAVSAQPPLRGTPSPSTCPVPPGPGACTGACSGQTGPPGGTPFPPAPPGVSGMVTEEARPLPCRGRPGTSPPRGPLDGCGVSNRARSVEKHGALWVASRPGRLCVPRVELEALKWDLGARRRAGHRFLISHSGS